MRIAVRRQLDAVRRERILQRAGTPVTVLSPDCTVLSTN
jgi:hypothetical protein